MDQELELGTSGGTVETRLGETTFTGSISGPGQLRLKADDTWGTFLQSRYVFSGVNTYSGGTVLDKVSATVTGVTQGLGPGAVTLNEGAVLGLSSEANVSVGAIAMKPGSVLVLNGPTIDPGKLINPDPLQTTGGVVSLGVNRTMPIDMAQIGNGRLFLGSSSPVTYSANTLGPGLDDIYRIGGGSLPFPSTGQNAVLTFSGTDNLFTGARMVMVGNSEPISGEVSRGTVLISTANDYSGGTILVGGGLFIGHDAALGSGALSIGTAVRMSAAGASRSISNPIMFTGSGLTITGA